MYVICVQDAWKDEACVGNASDRHSFCDAGTDVFIGELGEFAAGLPGEAFLLFAEIVLRGSERCLLFAELRLLPAEGWRWSRQRVDTVKRRAHAARDKRSTLVHEIGHILIDSGKHPNPRPNEITDQQCKRIYESA